MTSTETLRRADLNDIVAMLRSQRVRSIDLVAPAKQIQTRDGNLVLATGPQLSADGVTQTFGTYRPNEVANEGLAEKLGIPRAYLRRCHTEHVTLYDQNVNGWLERSDAKLLVRLLRADNACEACLGTGEVPGYVPDAAGVAPVWDVCPECQGRNGIVRAVLSDRFRAIDNLDVLLAALNGVRAAGVERPEIEADLTERRMYVRVTAPEIRANALQLVKDYRDPITGRDGRNFPLMWAGFVITNSETGDGKFSIIPRVVLQVCTNGQTITADALGKVHVGGRLDEGIVKWSDETLAKNLELITSQTKDAVSTFLTPEYVATKVRELTVKAGIEITDPVQVIEHVSKRLGFSDEQAKDILGAFIRGGSMTSGGVMHAVTATALHQENGDDAAEMEAKALDALAIASGTVRS